MSTSPAARPALRLTLPRIDHADRDEPVDRLDRVDRVAAGDRDARAGADRLAAVENLADHVERQRVDRHADDARARTAACRPSRRRRRCALVAAIAPKSNGIVDDRHEEVGRGDDRLAFVESVDGGVVGGLDADQQASASERSGDARRGSAAARRGRSCSRNRRRARTRSGGAGDVRGRSSTESVMHEVISGGPRRDPAF